MGLDVDEDLARDIVSKLVAKAASMTPPGFVRVDMEGSPYTQRTLDFVHELHRMPGNANSVGTVIQSYLNAPRATSKSFWLRTFASASARRLQKNRRISPSPPSPTSTPTTSSDENLDEERHLATSGHARRKYHSTSPGLRDREKISRDSFEFQMLYGSSAVTCSKAGTRGVASPHLHSFLARNGIPIHAAAGRAPGQCFFIARNLLRS